MKWKLAACRINKGLKQKDVAELMHGRKMIFKCQADDGHYEVIKWDPREN